jgi:transposase
MTPLAGIFSTVAEGMNSKIQLIRANARGFRNFEKYRVAILFHCGALSLYPPGSR